jgi:hypothetical protein
MPRHRSAKTAKMHHKKVPRALPGTLIEQYVTCGKTTCKCQHGSLHGPYHYRLWREHGKRRNAYVRLRDVSAVRRACAVWHQERYDERRRMREALDYSRMSAQELIAEIKKVEQWIAAHS